MSKTIKWLAKEQYPLTHNDEWFNLICLRAWDARPLQKSQDLQNTDTYIDQ